MKLKLLYVVLNVMIFVTTSRAIEISCETLYHQAVKSIPERTGTNLNHDASCNSALINLLLQQFDQNYEINDESVAFNLNQDTLADLLTFSAIGKISTFTSDNNRLFLEFDNTKNVLTIVKPRCEYHKTLYGGMLLIAVISLIYIIVKQSLHSSRLEETQDADMSSKSVISNAPMQSSGIQFDSLRLRGLRV